MLSMMELEQPAEKKKVKKNHKDHRRKIENMQIHQMLIRCGVTLHIAKVQQFNVDNSMQNWKTKHNKTRKLERENFQQKL